jgi:glycosyltransferase involved in cell wall biosynthesis
MRLTFVLPYFSRRPIGGLRVVYEIANVLARRGHEVTAVHPRGLPDVALKHDLRSRASRLVDRAVALRGVPWMSVDPRVRSIHVSPVDDRSIPDADVVFATSWQTAKPVLGLAAGKGRKHYIVMDFYPYIAPRPVLEESWRSGMRIAAVSRWLADLVLEAGVRREDVTSISNGVSSVHRSSTKPGARAPSIAMMYGLANYKAPGDGLRALELARREMGPVPVCMFGPNASRRPAELPPWVEYRPLVSDAEVNRIYNAAAVFVSSSVAEGFCLPAAEAMSSGCAVVATDSGGIRDFAVHGENALLSPPGEPEALARNIVRALRDAALRERLAAAGAERIRGFTWEAVTDRLESFIGEEAA